MKELEAEFYPRFRICKKSNFLYNDTKSIIKIKKNKSQKNLKLALIGIFDERQLKNLEEKLKKQKDNK